MLRRRLMKAALALPAGLLVSGRTLAQAQSALALTPECRDKAEATLRQTEGPFYSPRTPRKDSLVEPGARGERITVTGLVLTPDCRPLPQAMLDVWQADENGEYDNAGFRYRGHLFADAQGRFRFETIMPGLYPGRTRHIHVKVQPLGKRLLTTQLYFAGDPGNARDGIYRPELQMKREGGAFRFDFVVQA